MSLGTILLILLLLTLVGVIPTWPHSRSWGYGPSGALSHDLPPSPRKARSGPACGPGVRSCLLPPCLGPRLRSD
ncbi:MAG: DUF3309 domain-containing protein [Gammaproteobacteria bacterium]|nr:DUF3309 domain-containing protein [Gammaproteobacteria bacterium]